jgi:hypothetical protein
VRGILHPKKTSTGTESFNRGETNNSRRKNQFDLKIF